MGALDGWKLGWIGVGRMGTPLCRRLLEAGAEVTATDPDHTRIAALAQEGLRAAMTAAGLAEQTDIILSMVPNDAALLAVTLGPGGLAEEIRPGQVFIDLSTVSPATSAQVAEALAARGADYLRCPVSGSTSTAASGTLTIFASGPEAALDRCAPLLGVLGKETLRCGTAEEARAVKLMVNLVVALTPAIIGEALAFGGRLGLDWEAMVEALSKSVVASPLLAYKAGMLKARDWTPAADLDLIAKDLDLALAVGLREGAPMPLSALARQFAAAYQASGEGELDFFRLATWPERLLAPNPR
ncbi:NAD(P)-dependent oxidoreductase [Pseudoroseomonas wenyumeiae]|uniref:NAD(P)-dependent oxidoreductase n=1 Tax=Teichococcus wenyumeiae TaxID=2478470 RepID=A0A3A9JDM2_9PROT|nr:NAD(P)-dependent oxidoreductase [Pseudoroseomonas wenyumeiae]RKK05447.1 NAD(P)-dependent oxidoreductase [Pseudoroseomonas wenyumeiae]RMI19615.1 NAD(P)-dependent oxidoreductase [Pseudoroseomonas wenyumeiae]